MFLNGFIPSSCRPLSFDEMLAPSRLLDAWVDGQDARTNYGIAICGPVASLGCTMELSFGTCCRNRLTQTDSSAFGYSVMLLITLTPGSTLFTIHYVGSRCVDLIARKPLHLRVLPGTRLGHLST